VEPRELPGYSPNNPLISLEFQQKVEQDCWKAAGSTQAVPAQRLIDFVEGKKSKDFPRTSYQPGIVSVDLNEVLPDFIAKRLRQAFKDAVLHAPESRTSSPVSVPRDNETCMSINTKGLFPCGEGAGYAGGIISAAIDGMKCVDAVDAYFKSTVEEVK
jgi:uncharacterized FAD-dependent dehydrogenase